MKIFEALDRRRRWSGEEALILEQVQRVVAESIAPHAARFDANGEFPTSSVEALNGLGLNAIFIPEAHGGIGAPFRLYAEIVKTISAACASTGIIYATNMHAIGPLIEFGTEEQKARFLPRMFEGGLAALAITEAEAGSDAIGMQTRFTPDGDSIVIDGSKLFITSGDVADLILLFGKWSDIADPKRAISVLVLKKGTPGFSVNAIEKKMGHRASSTAALSFSGVRVPRANLVGAPGDGLKILLASLNRSRPSIAAHAIGIARAAFADTVEYINLRRQSGHRIVEFQGIQFLLADLASELALTEAWLDHVCAQIDDGERDFGVEASIAKMRASDLAMRMTTEAVQLHGGSGYCQDLRVERLMRDAKITQIWEGTNQVHRQFIGKSFVRK
ncbi:acyl-CoA dehydrogenase family protein [Chelatococcus asaccharovorans]|uniref:3-sulfinopropanoyl-CoA desulfinase n=1 Tax=Chelatococcus asaccharovorans TaxID=28210 RepID=A0A2V3U5V4_9HYPH|nr:acyl-CoA dehydrogenase family protein [Chelatococcus asaccharovorans]MBS7703720.1 acyl-CoA dehydrogenase family protein [Chelatococcus asaccharovorans]PXW57878.1 alkylation response protein AidB-like acyl-CoA dehydrogenase [Chelatococcus asaccharovorans]